MDWNNLTLYQFQEIERINENKKLDDLDKILWTTCCVFGLTEHQLDSMSAKKAGRLMTKVSKIFSAKFEPMPAKRIGRYVINYNPATLTLGQYVELSFFLQGNLIQNAHYILASVSHLPFLKNRSAAHRSRAEYFLGSPLTNTIGSANLFAEKFKAFNKEYSSLFGLDKTEGDEESDPFNRRFGWQFSAREVARDEGITLDQAYQLPIRYALNTLSYLKAKGQYEERQMKKIKAKSNVR